MNYTKIASKLREQIFGFSGELSRGFPKVVRRFVAEIVFGIQARGSVRLTEVGRALGEEIALKKTEERLCRQLGRPWLEEAISRRIIHLAAPRIHEDTLLMLDISDVSKKYAQKMEYLARVRDGSEKELANGYWTLNVIGTDSQGVNVIPLYGRLFSHTAPDHKSENEEIREAIRKIAEKTKGQGTWIMDRGGDRDQLFDYVLDNRHHFLIRLRADRGLEANGQVRAALALAQTCPTLFYETMTKIEDGQKRLLRLECGLRRVRLPGRAEVLTLVVVKGFGDEPLMMLTDLPLRRSRKSLWQVISYYLLRWRIEESIRFHKQSYDLEDIRLLTYTRLQNMMALVTAAAFCAAVYLGLRLRLRVLARHLLRASKRLFGIPDFRLYALADGIRNLLYSQTKGLKTLLEKQPPAPLQLLLFVT